MTFLFMHRIWQALGVHVSFVVAVMDLYMPLVWLEGRAEMGRFGFFSTARLREVFALAPEI